MREVLLGRNQKYTTWVSDEDYAWVVQWRWQYKVSRQSQYGAKVYAKRSHRVDGKRVTTLLSHAILIHRMGQPRPSPEHDADHRNDNSLINTRENLAWEHKLVNQTRPHRKASYHGTRTYGPAGERVARTPDTSGESPPF